MSGLRSAFPADDAAPPPDVLVELTGELVANQRTGRR